MTVDLVVGDPACQGSWNVRALASRRELSGSGVGAVLFFDFLV